MHQFVIVNILIIILIIFGISATMNPMLVFGLMFLVPMPHPQAYEEDDDDEQPMGFTAKIA